MGADGGGAPKAPKPAWRSGTALLTLYLIIDKLFFRDMLPGYVSTIAAIVFLGGVQIMVTGMGSLYIGRVLVEVQGRPLFVVRERVGDLPVVGPP